MEKTKLYSVPKLAEYIFRNGEGKTLNSVKTGLYQKIKRENGIEKRIVNGHYYSTLEWIEEYNSVERRGKVVKV